MSGFFSKIFLYVYCVAFLFGLNHNLFQFLFFLNFIIFCFVFGTRFDQEPQYNSIHFTQFALETCFDLRSILLSVHLFVCLSVLLFHIPHPLECALLALLLLLLLLCSSHCAQGIIIIQSHGSADCFCILFLLCARSMCVCVFACVFFCFALLCSAQFDELLSSPFVKLRCAL